MSRSHQQEADARVVATVAERVAETRKSKGWSQAGLAHELGIEPATLSRYEVGSRPFPVALLARIASVLGVPLSSLLPGTEQEPPESDLGDLIATWDVLDRDRRTLLIRIAREMARR